MIVAAWPWKTEAHPRACGENQTKDTAPDPATGSSPRVRGKRPVAGESDGLVGLIPARAGKTQVGMTLWGCSWAHPRACGENAIRAETVNGLRGSSPRVRGKRTHDGRGRRPRGLIPARAGKTQHGPGRTQE